MTGGCILLVGEERVVGGVGSAAQLPHLISEVEEGSYIFQYYGRHADEEDEFEHEAQNIPCVSRTPLGAKI